MLKITFFISWRLDQYKLRSGCVKCPESTDINYSIYKRPGFLIWACYWRPSFLFVYYIRNFHLLLILTRIHCTHFISMDFAKMSSLQCVPYLTQSVKGLFGCILYRSLKLFWCRIACPQVDGLIESQSVPYSQDRKFLLETDPAGTLRYIYVAGLC